MLFVYAAWKSVHMGALQIMPVFLLGETATGGLGMGQSHVATVLASASVTFLLLLMLCDWLCDDCDHSLHCSRIDSVIRWFNPQYGLSTPTRDHARARTWSNSSANGSGARSRTWSNSSGGGGGGGSGRRSRATSRDRSWSSGSAAGSGPGGLSHDGSKLALAVSLRTAVALQVPALTLMAGVPWMQRQEWPDEVIWVLLIGGVALMQAALVSSQVRGDVWLPSLQECRGSTRLSNWLFTGADALGALMGPLMYAAVVAPGAAGAMPFLTPKALFHFSAALGVALCASTHIFV